VSESPSDPGGLPGEFSLIARHFRPLAGSGALGLVDDAALLAPPPGRELVIAADAMVAGVHFLPDDPPDLVGAKLLRVNLSDLAAMGADPLAYLMTISAPRGTDDVWFARFAAGLAADQARYGIVLLGGDTTSTPGPLTLSLTIIGHVEPGGAVRRSGARPGDEVWVTGTVGDGALGLAALRGQVADPDGRLAGRYRLPQPRLGLARRDLVRACLDVSDGLVQDLGHLCRAAGIGAELEAAAVPLSPEAHAAGASWLETCLTGGDDYELLMAVPREGGPALAAHAHRLGVAVTRIGRFTPDPTQGVTVLSEDGRPMPLARGGWSHF
jgi:thiamine-monophosphate kinase